MTDQWTHVLAHQFKCVLITVKSDSVCPKQTLRGSALHCDVKSDPDAKHPREMGGTAQHSSGGLHYEYSIVRYKQVRNCTRIAVRDIQKGIKSIYPQTVMNTSPCFLSSSRSPASAAFHIPFHTPFHTSKIATVSRHQTRPH